MVPDPKPPDASESAELVAYLDGELPEVQARALAAQVSRSPSALREVEALRGTWDLLDLLPRAEAPADFGPRTLSALRRVADPAADGLPLPGRRPVRSLVYVAATLLMAGVGFAATRWAGRDPGGRLASQLSLAEHLDDYRAVGSIEFLQVLDTSPEFDDTE